jgi:membrane-associated phospholipid phosphatase
MRTLTDFGDAATLLPLSVVIFAWFLFCDSRRVAGWWAIGVCLCILTTALLKIFLYADPPASDLVSPSGHSSLSVLVYGTVTLVIATEWKGWGRLVVLGIGFGLVAGIAGSRLWLDAHSAPEITVGLIIGLMTLAFFADQYLRWRREGKQAWLIILSTIMVNLPCRL